METLTVTTQNAINYGAVLQAYALHHTLRGMGVNDRLLDLSKMNTDYYDKVVFGKRTPGILYNNIIKMIYRKQITKKEHRFIEFINNNIILTKNYKTMDDVLSDPPSADVYITGGDQMFNYTSVLRPTNYLEFGDESIKRISYSTSLGENEIMKGHEEDFKNKLIRYHSISLREQNSKAFVEEILNKEVSVNIDPTFLIDADYWGKLSKATVKGKYILCYCLLNNKNLENTLNKLKKATGLDVVVINPQARCYIKGDKIIRDAGPEEFLGLIKNAEWVVSTSFHGICFSLMFERPFYCLIKQDGDIRYDSLLTKMGLTERIIRDGSDFEPTEIDYTNIREIIKKERENGIEYLRNTLEI